MRVFIFLCFLALCLAQQTPAQQQQAPQLVLQQPQLQQQLQPSQQAPSSQRAPLFPRPADEDEGEEDRWSELGRGDSVEEWTNSLYTALVNRDVGSMRLRFNEDSTLHVFGHEFKGEEIELAMYMFSKSVRLDNIHYEIIAVDDSKLSSIVKITSSGEFLKTNTPFTNMEVLHVVKWGDAIVDEIISIHKNMGEELEMALPKAEQNFWKFIWKLFSGGERLITASSPVLDLVDDSYELKVFMYPIRQDMQSEFHGRQGFIQAYEMVQHLGSMLNLQEGEDIDLKVIYSDDKSVFIQFTLGDVIVFKNQTWSDNDKLLKEELIFADPIKPWYVLPAPLPQEGETGQGVTGVFMGPSSPSSSTSQFSQPIFSATGGAPQAQQQPQPVFQQQGGGILQRIGTGGAGIGQGALLSRLRQRQQATGTAQ